VRLGYLGQLSVRDAYLGEYGVGVDGEPMRNLGIFGAHLSGAGNVYEDIGVCQYRRCRGRIHPRVAATRDMTEDPASVKPDLAHLAGEEGDAGPTLGVGPVGAQVPTARIVAAVFEKPHLVPERTEAESECDSLPEEGSDWK
jgi:hypothetical protein